MTESDKRKEKGLKTRQRIIEATLEVLSEQGKEGLTSRAIAERAGIGKGSLFHHFANMDEILDAVYDALAEAGGQVVQGTESAKTPREYIRLVLTNMMDYIIGSADQMTGFISLYEIAMREPRLWTKLQTTYKLWMEYSKEQLVARMDYEPDPKRLRQAMLILSSMIEGTGIVMTILQNPEDYRETIDPMVNCMTALIEKSATPETRRQS